MRPKFSAKRKKKVLELKEKAKNGVVEGMPTMEFYRSSAPLQVPNRPFAFFSDGSTLAVVPGTFHPGKNQMKDTVLDMPTRPPSACPDEPDGLHGDDGAELNAGNMPNPYYVRNRSGQQNAGSRDPSQHERRMRQYNRWMKEVVPLLEHEYMEIMQKTQFMRHPISQVEGEDIGTCRCDGNVTRLNVLCVSLDSTSFIAPFNIIN